MIRAYTLIQPLGTANRHLIIDQGDPELVLARVALFDLLGDMVLAFCKTGQEEKLANVEAQLRERGELAPVRRADVPEYVFVAQCFTAPKQSERRVRAAG